MKTFFNLLLIFGLIPSHLAQKLLLKSNQPGTSIFTESMNYYSGVLNKQFIGVDSATYPNYNDELLVFYGHTDKKLTSKVITRNDIKKQGKRIILEPLQFFPEKTNSIRYIKVSDVTLKVNKKNYAMFSYENYKAFQNNESINFSYSESDLSIENSIFDKDLNHFLIKHGYLDTTGKLTLSDVNRVMINITVSKVVENWIGRFKNLQINGKIEIINPLTEAGGEPYPFQVSSNTHNDLGTEEFKTELFLDALENALINFSNDTNLREELVNVEDRYKQIMDSWETIPISGPAAADASITKAVNSVVTIKTKNGHGSGCIISHDGYIITNNHVIGLQKDNIEILSGPNRLNATIKVVRSNPIYDLALIKIDTTFTDWLPIETNVIGVGNDVYCIGTPKDIELGQSISKGIISGKRKFDGKVYIQSDVSVNAGNSGGALINKEGKLVGVINAKFFGIGVEGVGFAIPVEILPLALKIDLRR